MKTNLTLRWIIICLIWTGAVALTLWNNNRIAVIMTEIEKQEIFQKDNQFWQYNAENISKLLAKKDSLVLPIESIKLGLLSVENSLTLLALKYRFSEVRMENIPGKTDDSGMLLRLYFEGSFEGILSWIETLQNELPYLSVKNVSIKTDPFSKQAMFQFQLNFRYRIHNSVNPT